VLPSASLQLPTDHNVLPSASLQLPTDHNVLPLKYAHWLFSGYLAVQQWAVLPVFRRAMLPSSSGRKHIRKFGNPAHFIQILPVSQHYQKTSECITEIKLALIQVRW
jgi:hypothetical protein